MLKQSHVEAICRQTIVAHRDQFQVLKERWLGLLGRYENKLRAGSISADTESKIALGSAFALVENAIPRIFNRQPKYKYLGREGKDGQSAEVYNEFSNYQWDESKAKQKIKTVARWGLVTGLAGWKMGWKEERRIIKKNGKEVMGIKVTNPLLSDMVEKLNIGKDVKIDEEQTISNYTIIPIKPFNMLWSVDADNPDEANVLGDHETRLVRELKYDGYDVSKLTAFIKGTDEWKERVAQLDGITPYQVNNLILEEKVHVAELDTKLLNDDGIYEYHTVTMAYTETGEPQTIGFERNKLDAQFRARGTFRPIDRLGKFYGFGLIEPSTGILDAEEDTLNMSMEAMWTEISKPMEYNPQNLLDVASLEYRPRTLVPVRTLGQSVLPMATPQLPTNAVSYMQSFLQKAKQNVSGITDYQTGSEQMGGGKTLGEVRIKTQESNARIAMIVEAFEEQVLEPIGKMALHMNKQFLSDSKKKYFYRIVGKKGEFMEKTIKAKDIEAVKDIVIVSGSSMMVDQVAEYQKWNSFLQLAQLESQQPNPVPIDKEAIVERLIEQGLLISDIETFLPNKREREESAVTGDMAQMDDAEQESDNPATARVLPTDNHQLHLQIHQAVANAGAKSDGQPLDPEEMLMLTDHINAHTQAGGGQIPAFSQSVSQGAGQAINSMMNPQAEAQPQ